VSLILDALRRTSSEGGTTITSDDPERTARTDAVLATLGYSRPGTRRRSSAKRLFGYGALALVVGFGGLSAVILMLSPSIPPAPVTVARAPTPRAQHRAASAVPAPVAATPGTQAQPAGPALIAPRLEPTLPPAVGERQPAAPSATSAPAISVADSAATKPTGAPSAMPPPLSAVPKATPSQPVAPLAALQPVAPPLTTAPAPPLMAPRTPAPPVPRAAASDPRAPTAPDGRMASVPGREPAPLPSGSGRRMTARASELAPDPAPPSVPSAPVEDHFALALFSQRTGDYDGALAHYRVLLERHDASAEVHNNLGLLYQDRGQSDDAVKQFQRAIAIDPKSAKAHNNLGVAFMRANQLTQAASEFRVALACDPRNVESLVNLALVERSSGRLADARALLRRALTIDPRNAGSHYNLAVIADESGEAMIAIEHYRAFLRFGSLAHADLTGQVRARLTALGSG
jgi:Tfp pilus assembly protein PilF